MKYFRFAILTIINLLFTILAWILAPVLPLFLKDDGFLPNWLVWFQTPDNSCDAGWKLQGNYGTYLKDGTVPKGLTLYWYRVLWLFRNPAYGFCYYPLGIPVVPDDWIIDEYQESVTGQRTLLKAHTKDGRYFAYTNNKGLKLGWKIWSNFRGLDKDGNPVWDLKPWGPELRTAICFTP